ALTVAELPQPGSALPRLRRRLRGLVDERRFEDAARLRDRLAAVETVCRELERQERLRRLGRCLLAPGLEPGHVDALFVAGGRIAAQRTLPPGAGVLEVEAGLAAARRARADAGDAVSLEGTELDELLLLETFLRRPPPELRVARLRRDAILAAAAGLAALQA
ncbi:MAG TPA: UvrB/UvrC motif-containing protein, partial [Gaiellaceae bacterium]|nr:UvrB/UvrC motif-containing protein [Gaiellaceae bacterium]